MHSQNIRKTIPIYYFILIVIIHLTFSYFLFRGWWYSSIGTSLILLISYLAWKKDFLKNIGLRISQPILLLVIFMAGFITLFSFFISGYIADQHGVYIIFTNWRDYFHDVFYTLNEEIVIGALPLFYCARKFRTHPLIISAVLAVIFSVIHFIFYRWIFLGNGILSPLTLTTLFFVGFMRNNLILAFGHIGYSWAFHFGWMAVMFGSYHYYAASFKGLLEYEKFNLYLGSSQMLFISIILAVLSGLFLYRGAHPTILEKK